MTNHQELIARAREFERINDRCPECNGTVEVTPSGGITCREHGSEHYRWQPENYWQPYVDSGAGRREAGEDFSYAVESEDEWL